MKVIVLGFQVLTAFRVQCGLCMLEKINSTQAGRMYDSCKFNNINNNPNDDGRGPSGLIHKFTTLFYMP